MLLDFWRGARQVRRRLRRRPVRLCVGYGVGLTQKYKLGLMLVRPAASSSAFAVVLRVTPATCPWTLHTSGPHVYCTSTRKTTSTPECTLDDGAGRHIWAGRHVSPRPPPIPLVYNMANLIGVDPSMHSFVYYFVIDLAILQKYYVLTLES